ncbi:MAG: hypothetical protein INR69_06970 [Mucilaginibacter polytrichastri]|nr:hypothetical protein [Mucilaginibacter polytrichastri]
MYIQIIIDVLKTAFAGIIIFAAVAYWAKPHIARYFRLRQLEVQQHQHSQSLTLKLQAYERLLIFIDRINPKNMILRLHDPELSAVELQTVLLNEIRAEFQHNSSQQLYVSPKAWETVSELKENTLTLINRTAGAFTVADNASSFGRAVLENLGGTGQDPYRAAATLLKSDLDGIV